MQFGVLRFESMLYSLLCNVNPNSAESVAQLSRDLSLLKTPTPGGVGCDILRTEAVNRTNRVTVSHGSQQAKRSGPG
jgi:hypothetical protein